MALLCGWHQIIGISREVEFSGCPGTRQCLGLGVTGTRVKVERRLVLFCSCAVQQEVFLVWQFSGKFFPAREWGKGSLVNVYCCHDVLCKAFGHVFYQYTSVSLLLSTWQCTCKCQTLMEWLVGWSAEYKSNKKGSDCAPCQAGLCVVCWCGYGAVGRCGSDSDGVDGQAENNKTRPGIYALLHSNRSSKVWLCFSMFLVVRRPRHWFSSFWRKTNIHCNGTSSALIFFCEKFKPETQSTVVDSRQRKGRSRACASKCMITIFPHWSENVWCTIQCDQ